MDSNDTMEEVEVPTPAPPPDDNGQVGEGAQREDEGSVQEQEVEAYVEEQEQSDVPEATNPPVNFLIPCIPGPSRRSQSVDAGEGCASRCNSAMESEGTPEMTSSDASYTSMDEDTACSSMDVEEYDVDCIEELLNWDGKDSYELWKLEGFRAFAASIVQPLKLNIYNCANICQRGYKRLPTVHEFWNFVFGSKVPRDPWYGYFKTLETEKRGWPLTEKTLAKVLVRSVAFDTPLSPPKFSAEIVESFHAAFPVGMVLEDVGLQQFDILELYGDDTDKDESVVSVGNEILHSARRFWDYVHLPFDTENLVVFIENCLYQRLTLLYYLQNKAPNEGVLSVKNRGRIIAALRYYIRLRNIAQGIPIKRPIDGSNGENVLSNDVVEARAHLDLADHLLEMRKLLDPVLRNIANALPASSSANECFETILVMDTVETDDLFFIYDTLDNLEQYKPRGSIQVLADLDEALARCVPGGSIYVVSGNYTIGNLGKISDGGVIIGIKLADKEITITPSDEVGDVWMLIDPKETPVFMENLTFVIEEVDTSLSTLMFVTSGTVKLKKCAFRNVCDVKKEGEDKKLITPIKQSVGALVLKEDCSFTNFEVECCQDDVEVVLLE